MDLTCLCMFMCAWVVACHACQVVLHNQAGSGVQGLDLALGCTLVGCGSHINTCLIFTYKQALRNRPLCIVICVNMVKGAEVHMLYDDCGKVQDESGCVKSSFVTVCVLSMHCPVLSCVSGALWCYALFNDLHPDLWNPVTTHLAQPHAAAALQPVALTQIYQVRQEARGGGAGGWW